MPETTTSQDAQTVYELIAARMGWVNPGPAIIKIRTDAGEVEASVGS